MTNKILSVAACLAALFFMASSVPGMGDEDDASIQYVMRASARYVPLGQSLGLSLSVTNNSGAALMHVLNPSAYEVAIDGPDGHHIWFFLEHIMPTGLRLQTGQTTYLFGGATTYQYPDSAYFEKSGTYHIRYCDRWAINGHRRKICSNNLEIHVGAGK